MKNIFKHKLLLLALVSTLSFIPVATFIASCASNDKTVQPDLDSSNPGDLKPEPSPEPGLPETQEPNPIPPVPELPEIPVEPEPQPPTEKPKPPTDNNTSANTPVQPNVENDNKTTNVLDIQSYGNLYPTAINQEQAKKVQAHDAVLIEQYQSLVPSFLISINNYMNYIYMKNSFAKELSEGNFKATNVSHTDTTATITFTNNTQKLTKQVVVNNFLKQDFNNPKTAAFVFRSMLDLPSNLSAYGANTLNNLEMFKTKISISADFSDKFRFLYHNEGTNGKAGVLKDNGIQLKIETIDKKNNYVFVLKGFNSNSNAIPYNGELVKAYGVKKEFDDEIANKYSYSEPRILQGLLKSSTFSKTQGKEAFDLLEHHYVLKNIPSSVSNLSVKSKELVPFDKKDSTHGWFYRSRSSVMDGSVKASILLTLSNDSTIKMDINNLNVATHSNVETHKESLISDSFYLTPKKNTKIIYNEIKINNVENLFDINSSNDEIKETELAQSITVNKVTPLQAPTKPSNPIENKLNYHGLKIDYTYVPENQPTKKENNSWVLKDIPLNDRNVSYPTVSFDQTKAKPVSQNDILNTFLNTKKHLPFSIKEGYIPLSDSDEIEKRILPYLDKSNVSKENLIPALTQKGPYGQTDKWWFHKIEKDYILKVYDLNTKSNDNKIKFKFGYIDKYDHNSQWYDTEWREVTLLGNQLQWFVDNTKFVNDPSNITITKTEKDPSSITLEQLFIDSNDSIIAELSKYYKIEKPKNSNIQLSFVSPLEYIYDRKQGVLYVLIKATDTSNNKNSVTSGIYYGLQFKGDDKQYSTTKISGKEVSDALYFSKNDYALYNYEKKEWIHKDKSVQNQMQKLWKLSSNKKAIEMNTSMSYFDRLNTDKFIDKSKISFKIPYVYLTDKYNYYYDIYDADKLKKESEEIIKYPLEFIVDWSEMKSALNVNNTYKKEYELKLSTGYTRNEQDEQYQIDYKVFKETVIFNATKNNNDLKLSISFKNNKQIFTNYQNVDINNPHGIFLLTAADIITMYYKDNKLDTISNANKLEFNYTNPLAADSGAGAPVVASEKFESLKLFDNISTTNLTTNISKDYKYDNGFIPDIQMVNRKHSAINSLMDNAKRRTFKAGASWTMLAKVKPNDKNDLRFYVTTNEHVVSQKGDKHKIGDIFWSNIAIPPLPENNYRNDISASSIPIEHFWLGGMSSEGIENRFGLVNRKSQKVIKDGIDAAILILDLKDIFSYIKNSTTDKTVSLALYNYFNAWMDMEPLKIERTFQEQPPLSHQDIIFGGFTQGFPGGEFVSHKLNKGQITRGPRGTMTYKMKSDKNNVFSYAFYKGSSGTSFITENNKLYGLLAMASFGGSFRSGSIVPFTTPTFDYIGSSADKVGYDIGNKIEGYSFYQVLMYHILTQPENFEMVDIF